MIVSSIFSDLSSLFDKDDIKSRSLTTDTTLPGEVIRDAAAAVAVAACYSELTSPTTSWQ